MLTEYLYYLRHFEIPMWLDRSQFLSILPNIEYLAF